MPPAPGRPVVLDAEDGLGRVDVGRQQPDAETAELLAEAVELVRVGEVEGHRRGEELQRIVGLEVGRLIGDQRVGGRVRLVEAVSGELADQLEDLARLRLGHAARDGAADEGRALLVHLLLDLLAHGAAQQIGAAERIAAQLLGDLHHLLLVDHDAVGLAQDVLERRIEIVGLLLAVLAADVARDVVHRARPVEGDDGDDVLEGVGLQLAQHVPHAGAFQLEHADGVAAAQQLEGGPVVQRQVSEVDRLPSPAAHQLDRVRQDGERLQAQEVELHQPSGLDPLHVEAGDQQLGARVAVERNRVHQRPVADHHAGRVRRSVAVETLQTPGDVDQPADGLVLGDHRLQLRLRLQRAVEADRVGRIVRHQLADPVDLAVGQAHAPGRRRATRRAPAACRR